MTAAPVFEGVVYRERYRATWREGSKRRQWTWYAPYPQAAREALERHLRWLDVPSKSTITVRFLGHATVAACARGKTQAP